MTYENYFKRVGFNNSLGKNNCAKNKNIAGLKVILYHFILCF